MSRSIESVLFVPLLQPVVMVFSIGIIGASVASGQQADVRPESLAAAEAVLAAGDGFAKQRRYDDALMEYKKAYEFIVPNIRKLSWVKSVAVRFLPRSEMRKVATEEMESAVSFAMFYQANGWYKLLGLCPQDFDLKQSMIDLLAEQVGGFYHPEAQELCLVREETKPRGLLGRWLLGPDFDPEEYRITLAHEMAHALADQHFDIGRLGKEFDYHDDYQMAVTALVEGEATQVMMAEMLQDREGTESLLTDAASLGTIVDTMAVMGRLFGGQQLRRAPPIIRESLLFPYVKGPVFIAHLRSLEGWKSVNDAFLHPPVSTEQILHPEKCALFHGSRDDPQWLELPKLEPLVETAGWRSAGQNTLGELGISVLLERVPRGAEAAAGWDGDRCQLFERSSDQWAIAWFTTWDSPEDARQFAVACSQWLDAKNRHFRAGGSGLPRVDADRMRQIARQWAAEPALRWTMSGNGSSTIVECRGEEVVIVDGFEESLAIALVEKLWSTEKSPWKLVRKVEPLQDMALTP